MLYVCFIGNADGQRLSEVRIEVKVIDSIHRVALACEGEKEEAALRGDTRPFPLPKPRSRHVDNVTKDREMLYNGFR